jgi:predicted dinucleotide-binding enzyme
MPLLKCAAVSRWTCAFKHTYYTLLQANASPPESDPHHVVVCGDDGDAAAVTMALVDCLPGFKSLFGGALKYTKMVEILSPLWLAQLERDNYGLSFRAGWRFGP